MCSGGRIVNYLKAMLSDPRHEVLFVGYQVRGAPGARIQACEGMQGDVGVDVWGERYVLRAKVVTLGGYSGHADQAGLVGFAMGGRSPAKRVALVHGEAGAKRVLAEALGWAVAGVGGSVEVTLG